MPNQPELEQEPDYPATGTEFRQGVAEDFNAIISEVKGAAQNAAENVGLVYKTEENEDGYVPIAADVKEEQQSTLGMLWRYLTTPATDITEDPWMVINPTPEEQNAAAARKAAKAAPTSKPS